VIREQLEAGKSRDEIVNYFVARYGDYVLMKPPYRGPGAVLWLLPLALLAALAVAAAVFLRHRRRVELPPPPALSAEDEARVRAERER
jgi:cytochrome c-type biogenesis protein CcmH